MVASQIPAGLGAGLENTDTPSHYPIPRWVSLRSDKIFARKGPSADHAVLWAYTQKGLPVQIISETHEWRLICDPDGATAWVRHDMVTSRREVMARGGGLKDTVNGAVLRAAASDKAPVISRLRARALAALESCRDDWCKVRIDKVSGWAHKSDLWGTQDQPACRRSLPPV